MNHKFKVGDLVRCVSNLYYDKYCKNKLGKIICIDNYNNHFLPYTIEFFEPVKGGHRGGNRQGKDGHCWNFFEEDVKLYGEPILKIFLKEKQNEI